MFQVLDRPSNAAGSLERLLEGNARFCKEGCHVTATPEQVAYLGIEGQHPFAVIVTCADSRVPPELIFGCGLGELFVIRTAGNVLSQYDIGSVEYAVAELGAQLVLVMGHTGCGAVAAAVAGHPVKGYLGAVLNAIEPSVKEARQACGREGEVSALAGELNIRRGVDQLRGDPELQGLPGLMIRGAQYETRTGQVQILE